MGDSNNCEDQLNQSENSPQSNSKTSATDKTVDKELDICIAPKQNSHDSNITVTALPNSDTNTGPAITKDVFQQSGNITFSQESNDGEESDPPTSVASSKKPRVYILPRFSYNFIFPLNKAVTKTSEEPQESLITSSTNSKCTLKCDVCSATFTKRKGLDDHKKMKHRVPIDRNVNTFENTDKSSKFQLLLSAASVLISDSGIAMNKTGKIAIGDNLTGLSVVIPTTSLQDTPSQIDTNNKKYRCSKCDYTTDRQPLFSMHCSSMHGTTPYQCEKCKKYFSAVRSLKMHMNNQKCCEMQVDNTAKHTMNYSHLCSVCGKYCKLAGNLTKHMVAHSFDRPFSCTICKATFKNGARLKNHMKIHSHVQPYKCSICSKSFHLSERLKMHMLVHSSTKPYNCNVCGRGFAQSCQLKTHMTIHSIRVKDCKCPVCGKLFYSNGEVKQHMKVHSSERPFSCCVCDASYKSLDALQRHDMVTHTGTRDKMCTVCGKSFFSNFNLKLHMRTHSDERNCVCTVCNASFKFKNHLKRHMYIHTGKAKNFVCSECGLTFMYNSDLKTHMKYHKGIKSHKCCICTKSFFRTTELRKHMLIHSDDKPYICSECGKCFKRKMSLQSHAEIHSSVKSYLCTVCGQGFSQKNSLVTHMRIHTGVKPFKCSVCKAAFIQSGHLRRHMSTHVKDEILQEY